MRSRMKWFIVLSVIIVLCGTGQSTPFSESDARTYVNFWLHTREKPDGQEIKPTEESFAESTFNASRPVRIYVHGFTNSHKDADSVMIREAYLQKGDFNVILTNWGELSASSLTLFMYPIVAASVKYVGLVLAEFTMFMNRTMKAPFEDMYVIGHSLGAQIAGYAGSMAAPYKYNTIFALDPAGPSFESYSDDHVVDKSDASYVEILHTDTNRFGMARSTGTASFFANFGSSQPDCATSVCDHNRSWELFAESINSPTPFLGKRCASNAEVRSDDCSYSQRILAPMGGEPSTPKEGIYYLATKGTSPYVLNIPDSAEIEKSTEIKLYTAASKNGRTVSVSDKTSLSDAGFDPTVPTTILICDYSNFNSTYASSTCQRIKNAYLARGKFNVFTYDWQNISSSYKKTLFADDISDPVTKLATLLKTGFNVDYDKMVAVGSGLGANIAAFASQRLAPGKLGTLFAIESNDNLPQDGVTYIESIKTGSVTHNGNVTVHVAYKYLVYSCDSDCEHEQMVTIFVKSLSASSKLKARKCEEYTYYSSPSTRCINPGAPAKVGGQPPVRKPSGEYYMQIDNAQ